MSAKWERSKSWDRAHLRDALTPVRWTLHALSSIPFAAAMIGVIALWGILGTIPLGWTNLGEFAGLPNDALARHLPSIDLTEGEWYRMWPMRAALLLFVLSMVVATVRRIEFRWINIGVLSVHAGIVLIALGGWAYSVWKQEGLMLLPMADGGAYTQREVPWFSDMTTPALVVRREGEAERVTVLEELPRYAAHELVSAIAVDDLGGVVAYATSMPVSYTWEPSDTSDGALAIPCWKIGFLPYYTSAGVWSTNTVLAGSTVQVGISVYLTSDDSPEWWEALLRDKTQMPAMVVLGQDQVVVWPPGKPPQRFMDIRVGDELAIPFGTAATGEIYSSKLQLIRNGEFARRIESKLHQTHTPLASDRHGGYDNAAIQVEYPDHVGNPQRVWVPFSIFGDDSIPIDERTSVAFTLARHDLPDAWVRADRFEVEWPDRGLLGYWDSSIAEDFIVGVTISDARGESSRTIRLNKPATLRTRPESNHITDRLASFLGSTRYALSVSGWDEQGAFRGEARYVVLTVGNTPGTDLVAVGAVLFALGTPWAMFVKPRIMRRRTSGSGDAS